MQTDMYKLEQCADAWSMQFNADKFDVTRVSPPHPSPPPPPPPKKKKKRKKRKKKSNIYPYNTTQNSKARKMQNTSE